MTDAEAIATTNQRIFDTTLDLILVVNRWGTFVRVSPSSERIIGYRPDEMIGRSAIGFIHPNDLENTREMMRQSRRGRETRHFDCRYVHKNGAAIILTWSGVWLEDVQQHVFSGRDITEARALESLGGIEHELREIGRRLSLRMRMAAFVRSTDIHFIELVLIFGSLWAAKALLLPPSNFAAYPETYAFAANLVDDEEFWGMFALVAAVVKITGLAIGWQFVGNRVSFALRTLGLTMSTIFWILMGMGTVVNNPDTLLGMTGFQQGLIAALVLIRLAL